MNNRALILSIGMAVLAVFFVQSYVSSLEEENRRRFGTEVLVLKAKKDIKEQETLNETMFELALIPKRFLEPASVHFEKREEDKETTRSVRSLIGVVAIVPIKKGEQITYNKITEPSVRTGLAPEVSPGKRAIAVPVSEISGVGKLVKPGDRVDVIASIDVGGGRENRLSKVLLQDVVVLSVGRNVTNNVARVIEQELGSNQPKVRSLSEDTSFNNVTLEVDPQEAVALSVVLASGDGGVSLALRNNDDSGRTQTQSLTIKDVLGSDFARTQRQPANGVQR